MSWKETDNIDNLLDKILRRTAACNKDKIDEIWNSMEESKFAKINTFKNGELIIEVANSAYLQILSFKREEIKRKLNESLGNKVNNIKLRFGG